jgi:hypothetical protein
VGGWPAATAFSFKGGFAAIALDIHLQDCRVVHEAIDCGQRHRWIGKDLAPFAERLI